MAEPQPQPERTPEQKKRQRQIYTLMIVALLGAVAAGLLLASSVWQWKASVAPPPAPKTNAHVADPEKTCAAQETYDGIKAELFRRAAQTRGGGQETMARVADFSLLRIQGPYLRGVDEELHRIVCSGTAVLQLPPQVATSDGIRTLTAAVDYSVQPAADGTGNVVTVGDASAITVPLATIRGVASAAPPMELDNMMTPEPSGNEVAPAPQPDQAQSEQSQDNGPSADCSASGAPAAVCNDPGLAKLASDLAWGYRRSLASATPQQRRLLQQTQASFGAYLNRCDDRACVANAYIGRMREIRDILAGQWQPQGQ